ncbi:MULTISPECIES: CbiQ family ECF transporter T component [Actinoalloteichus]|uniref:ABC-type cobalt transport system, permease component CbiQ n=1 Tax=Actinoalloteichus fjordicus TaxID=1612552 RepID=A0AAC9LB49_9PSEU|nr:MULTISPECIES: CbiQ family ECF transporter T component [Actinoalloteichus]APU14673.1 ABC-type cobalt transport system, permease component CbiQ [Actinoalloteichus fjordicus]APU20641.1 ABC-type cobalt transport system, permease component CbiQ [Actinoalloteichus sp. GBA129-24]
MTASVLRASTRLPRALHPGAWWLWALALAAAAGRTTNPLLLSLILVVAGYVVVRRRGRAPWAATFRMYVYLGVFIVVMRVLWRMIFGGGAGEHILFVLPEITLPEAAAGIRLLGPVSAEELLGGLYDGLRLATMLICLGAANSLADPRRMLKAVPAALYQISTAVVVALSVAPQLMESVLRVRRARRLRGGRQRGLRALRGIVVPVLADAMDRSLALASAMDSRGYGRFGDTPRRTRLLTGVLVIAGLLGVCVGVYGLLDGTRHAFGLPMAVAGLLVAGAGFLVAGRRIRRSVYRPDRWRLPETLVVLSGLTAALVLTVTAGVDPANLYPSLSPLSWPTVTLPPVLGILAGVAPAWFAPPPEVRS